MFEFKEKFKEAKPYFDFFISTECLQDDYENTIKHLYELGYRTIAINQNVEDQESDQQNEPNKKKKKKGETRDQNSLLIPEPFKITEVKGAEDMIILNRLTVIFSHQDFLHKVTKHPNYKKYKVIAALPTTSQALAYTCSAFEANILTFNPENKFILKLFRKSYNQLVERNYHFELLYSPCIEDSMKRKNMIQMAHLYHSYGKSKNVIISSGAIRPSLIRSPYDVINLGLIFGLSESQSKNAISYFGRRLYLHSVGKSYGKALMIIGKIDKPSDQGRIVNLESSVIEINDSTFEEASDGDLESVEINQPASKKIKH